jgi:hypothetical protein
MTGTAVLFCVIAFDLLNGAVPAVSPYGNLALTSVYVALFILLLQVGLLVRWLTDPADRPFPRYVHDTLSGLLPFDLGRQLLPARLVGGAFDRAIVLARTKERRWLTLVIALALVTIVVWEGRSGLGSWLYFVPAGGVLAGLAWIVGRVFRCSSRLNIWPDAGLHLLVYVAAAGGVAAYDLDGGWISSRWWVVFLPCFAVLMATLWLKAAPEARAAQFASVFD